MSVRRFPNCVFSVIVVVALCTACFPGLLGTMHTHSLSSFGSATTTLTAAMVGSVVGSTVLSSSRWSAIFLFFLGSSSVCLDHVCDVTTRGGWRQGLCGSSQFRCCHRRVVAFLLWWQCRCDWRILTTHWWQCHYIGFLCHPSIGLSWCWVSITFQLCAEWHHGICINHAIICRMLEVLLTAGSAATAGAVVTTAGRGPTYLM